MRSLIAALVVGAALLLGAASVAIAHEGGGEETLTVEPPDVTAGGSVLLAGSGLEPNDERVLLLKGENIAVEFGTVETDAEGMFSTELTIPDHLPTGLYQFQAIGDETLTVDVNVTAAAGAGASAEPEDAAEQLGTRERSSFELGLILAFAAVAGAIGVVLIVRAERFRGSAAT